MSKIAILGCGYIGRALGRQLIEDGHDVIGMCRSEESLERVEAAGLEPVQGDVTSRSDLDGLGSVDTLVFAASSGGGGVQAARAIYVEGLQTVLNAAADWDQSPDRLLYTSSTGVYGEHDGAWVDEESELRPSTEKTEVLAEAEATARRATENGIDPTVARLGGIYGPGRYRLNRYLKGPITEGYVNLVHRSDVASALRLLLTTDSESLPETVLLVDDEPVWKPTLAEWLAEQCGQTPPDTESPASDGAGRSRRGQKRCSNERLLGLGYEFEYPTYREGYRAAIEAYDG